MATFTAGAKVRASQLNDAVDGTLPVEPTFTAPWGNFGGGWKGLHVWKQGNTVHLKGMISASSSVAAGNSTVAVLATTYRPTAGTMADSALVGGSLTCRLDVGTSGNIVVVPNATVTAGTYVAIDTSWSLV